MAVQASASPGVVGFVGSIGHTYQDASTDLRCANHERKVNRNRLLLGGNPGDIQAAWPVRRHWHQACYRWPVRSISVSRSADWVSLLHAGRYRHVRHMYQVGILSIDCDGIRSDQRAHKEGDNLPRKDAPGCSVTHQRLLRHRLRRFMQAEVASLARSTVEKHVRATAVEEQSILRVFRFRSKKVVVRLNHP